MGYGVVFVRRATGVDGFWWLGVVFNIERVDRSLVCFYRFGLLLF